MTRSTRAAAAAILLVAATAALLTLMGRPPICTCGSIDLWVGQVNSSRTSQMLSDWYSPSHIVHGFLFYAALALVARKWPIERRFLAALTIEAAWEIVENTPMIINRYREATAALGYTGDSVLNSLSDIAMMGLGFLLARRLPVMGLHSHRAGAGAGAAAGHPRQSDSQRLDAACPERNPQSVANGCLGFVRFSPMHLETRDLRKFDL